MKFQEREGFLDSGMNKIILGRKLNFDYFHFIYIRIIDSQMIMLENIILPIRGSQGDEVKELI